MMVFLEILGTISFSVSGAIEAMKKGMDLLGVLVLGLVTAVGGGILRDIIIGVLPPAALMNPQNALIAISTAFITFIISALLLKKKTNRHSTIFDNALLISDAVGLGAFTVLGIRYVLDVTAYTNTALLLFVGVITGVGGGVMRDVFAGNIPYIFRKHVYATASIAGAVIYLWLEKAEYYDFAAITALTVVIILRLLAARFRWNLPHIYLQ